MERTIHSSSEEGDEERTIHGSSEEGDDERTIHGSSEEEKNDRSESHDVMSCESTHLRPTVGVDGWFCCGRTEGVNERNPGSHSLGL